MAHYAIYLRKSRADEELEKELGQGETLARHRKTLLEFARRKGLDIIKIYEELASGESILQRPAMLTLLKEVAQCLYGGVLVMDPQRLGRGDMEDQGIILKTFKNSRTQILTPDRTYDLGNEFDEEYMEFEAFMGRKEYKMINKRLQRGVLRSVADGNYLSPTAPFGYRIKEEKHLRTLEPDPAQAPVLAAIFGWYADQGQGCTMIADRLNSLGLRTAKGNRWTHNAVANVLRNPVYTGKITWRKTGPVSGKHPSPAKYSKARPPEEWIISDGKHEPLISGELFNRVREMMSRRRRPPAKAASGLVNPLAGIVVCKKCGSKMAFRTYASAEPHLICRAKCGNKSSKYKHVEARVLQAVEPLLAAYTVECSSAKENHPSPSLQVYKSGVENLTKELKELREQKNKLHDLLEQGVYDAGTFQERCKILSARLDETTAALQSARSALDEELMKNRRTADISARLKTIPEFFWETDDPRIKNLLLKEVVERVEYLKKKEQREDHFELAIYPKKF